MTGEMTEEREVQIHELKCWPEWFDAAKRGEKTAELRRNDRDYRVGDVLVLRRWDPEEGKFYQGIDNWLFRQVTHVLPLETVPGLEHDEGVVMLSFRKHLFTRQFDAVVESGYFVRNCERETVRE